VRRILNFFKRISGFVSHPLRTSKKVYYSLRYLGFRATLARIAEKIGHAKTAIIEEAHYNEWQRSREELFLQSSEKWVAEIAGWLHLPLISIVMPTYNSKSEWLKEAAESVIRQPYKEWELIIVDDASADTETRQALIEVSLLDPRIHVHRNQINSGISGATNVGIANAKGELVTFLDHDDVLAPQALYVVIEAYNQTDFDILYSDEDKLDGKRFVDPFFKPDYSPDYLLSCNYVNHLVIYKKSLLEQIGSLRSEYDGAQDHDLLLRAVEIAKKVAHLPEVLYHWRIVPGSTAESFGTKSYAHTAGKRAVQVALARRGELGEVLDTGYPGHHRVMRTLPSRPKVSIIVPTKDNAHVLRRCLESLELSTYENCEILVVDNGSQDPGTLDYLRACSADRVIRLDIPFNYSRLNNIAAKEADGEYLIFLNDDTVVISPDWIEEMLQHAIRSHTGAVGAKLLYPNGRIQHAGVILGLGGIAGHPYSGWPRSAGGYFSNLADIRDLSAVTAACLMVNRALFLEIDGFDEDNLAVAFNDVDLCLRLTQKGYYNVFTPYAQLYHHESLTRGKALDPAEVYYMMKRWGFLLQLDPFYNRNLSLHGEGYQLAPGRVVSKGRSISDWGNQT